MKKAVLTSLALFVWAALAQAQTNLVLPKVAPWNGHKAAVSLTFDDSDPSHLDVVIPELNRRGLHGTFFLIANRTDRKDEWRQALKAGHELANHTLDHLHANQLNPGQEESQVSGAQAVLQKTFGIPVLTFAYPYTEVSPGLLKWVQQDCFIARGGYGDNGGYYMKPESEPDWFNIPSQMTMTASPFSLYQGWIDQDFAAGAWMVFMIHGLEGTPWGYQPITKAVFNQILDALQAKDIWVETFSAVGAYWKAQKVFEAVKPLAQNGTLVWNWQVPKVFPARVTLKVGLPASGAPALGLYQDGSRLMPDRQGLYSVSFDDQELTEKPLLAN